MLKSVLKNTSFDLILTLVVAILHGAVLLQSVKGLDLLDHEIASPGQLLHLGRVFFVLKLSGFRKCIKATLFFRKAFVSLWYVPFYLLLSFSFQRATWTAPSRETV